MGAPTKDKRDRVYNPKGRGNSPNKATVTAREAIARFVDGNAHRLEKWLDQIAKENPVAAFDRYMAVVEYHIPKLARTEITGKDGERFQINVVTGVNAVDGEFQVVGDGGARALSGPVVDVEAVPETGHESDSI